MKVYVKGKIELTAQKFRPAILSLRETLGETQEGMARRIGCSFAAYSKWEHGKATPNGGWLLKLLALCPDDACRAAFGLESRILNLESTEPGEIEKDDDAQPPAPGPSPLTRQQRGRACEDMETAIRMICGRAPDQIVAQLDRLIRRYAGTYAEPRSKR